MAGWGLVGQAEARWGAARDSRVGGMAGMQHTANRHQPPPPHLGGGQHVAGGHQGAAAGAQGGLDEGHVGEVCARENAMGHVGAALVGRPA